MICFCFEKAWAHNEIHEEQKKFNKRKKEKDYGYKQLLTVDLNTCLSNADIAIQQQSNQIIKIVGLL